MLARYKIYRGRRPPDAEQLPNGIRQDTRKHTRHCLRPPAEAVQAFLEHPSTAAWKKFAARYRQSLQQRYAVDKAQFDELAELATGTDVYLGCSCPTAKNPDVLRCHTILALEFMRQHYPTLKVVFPSSA